ncbi:DUF106 domain-containing protein, partial [Candidatus Micrarchaeota archaeon]|nr:DUF106 domain-containing protein [Candidatus Micrarchaeota archaeon]
MMEYFFIIVTVLALAYSIFARVIQYRFGNQKEMEEINKKSRELNEKYKKATEEKNDAKAEAIMKEQTALLGGMGKMMMGQFKVMAMILVVFFGLMWIVGQIDPYTADDISLILVDDGTGC